MELNLIILIEFSWMKFTISHSVVWPVGNVNRRDDIKQLTGEVSMFHSGTDKEINNGTWINQTIQPYTDWATPQEIDLVLEVSVTTCICRVVVVLWW